jgi:hypothetical protein
MTDEPTPGQPSEPPIQQIQHSAATARIPDSVGRGVFSTGVIVLHGPNEYTIDFVQSLARPSRVAARVVLPPAVASQFVIALEQSLEKHAAAHGRPQQEPPKPPPAAKAADAAPDQEKPTANGSAQTDEGEEAAKPAKEEAAKPAPPPVPQPAPISDIYESLKLPDEMLGGAYANVVSISYSASEFCFDFIAQFFPRSAVTSRVYMAVPRVPELLGSLKRSIGGR